MAVNDEHAASEAETTMAGAGAPCRGRLHHDDLPRGAHAIIHASSPITALAYGPDGALLATGDAVGEICLRDSGSGQGRRRLAGHTGAITALDFTPDGSSLVSAGADGVLRIWDVAGGQPRHVLEPTPGPARRRQPPAGYLPAAITALAIAPDGSVLATGRWDGRVQLWETTRGRPTRDLSVEVFTVTALAFTHDGALLAVATEAELELHLYDLATGVRVFSAGGFTEPPLGAWFSRDGARLTAVDRKALMLRFDRAAASRYEFAPPRYLGTSDPARAMDVAGDTLILALGDGEAARIFTGDMEGTRQCSFAHGHGDDVLAIAISPDRARAASGDRGGRIILWSLADVDCSGPPAGGTPASGKTPQGAGAGTIPAAYRALRDSGCNPDRAGVATPIEARILRNVPHALAGTTGRDEDLAQLYASDGDWYRPGSARAVALDRVDAACVTRLKKHEDQLRAQTRLDERVEAVLTGSLAVFQGLRKIARPGTRLGAGDQRSTDDQTFWIAPCNQGCRAVEIVCDVDPGSGAHSCKVSRR